VENELLISRECHRPILRGDMSQLRIHACQNRVCTVKPFILISYLTGLLVLSACDSRQEPAIDQGPAIDLTWDEPTDISTWEIGVPPTREEECVWDHPTSSEFEIALRAWREYCDLRAVHIATLMPSLEGSHPDPGDQVLLTQSGRYLTNSATHLQVLEWDSQGNFVRAVGQRGEGPGEFSGPGRIRLFLSPGDSLFVRDGGSRWTVFDPDLNFVRTFPGAAIGQSPRSVHVLGRGLLTTGDLVRERTDFSFHLADGTGSQVRHFGPPPLRTGSRWYRTSALADPSSFWALPPFGEAAQGLRIEKWNLEGGLLRVLHRDAQWMPDGNYGPSTDTTEPTLPQYSSITVDERGLIWITVVVRSPGWWVVASNQERQDRRADLYNVRTEVIDPNRGLVVASFLWSSPVESPNPFYSQISGSLRGYRSIDDSNGLTSVEIFDLHLIKKQSVR